MISLSPKATFKILMIRLQEDKEHVFPILLVGIQMSVLLLGNLASITKILNASSKL